MNVEVACCSPHAERPGMTVLDPNGAQPQQNAASQGIVLAR